MKLVIDDFGTGYSSLSYLKRLPLDFLRSTARSSKGSSSAVIDLAQVLGMEAIAEGVESAEQAARLQQLGCHLAQGYRAFLGPYRPK